MNRLSLAVVTSLMFYTPTSPPPVDLALEPQTVSSCPLLSPLGYLLGHLTLACVQTQRLRLPPKLLSPWNPGPPLHDKRQLYAFSSSGQKNLSILPAFSFPLKLHSTQNTPADNPRRLLRVHHQPRRREPPAALLAGLRLSPAGAPGRALPPGGGTSWAFLGAPSWAAPTWLHLPPRFPPSHPDASRLRASTQDCPL